MSVGMSVDTHQPGRVLIFPGNTPLEFLFERVHPFLDCIMRPLLTTAAVAEYLSVSLSTVLRLIDRQELDVVRIGRAVRVPEEALERYVDAHTQYSRWMEGTS